MRRLMVVAAWLLAACGDARDATPVVDAPTTAVAITTTATPARVDDPVVARVAGRAIYASCVDAQATRGAPSARAALDECIAFELLAIAAEARGLARDPEVVEATRQALVNRFVEREFEAIYAEPASMQAELDTVLARDPRPPEQPARRASAYVRVDAKPDVAPAVNAAAKAAAMAMAADLVGQHGWSPAHLAAAGTRHAGGLKITHAEVKAMAATSLDPAYAEALFGLAAVGDVAGPVRTAFGWDVVLLMRIEPAHVLTREARITELFPQLRRQQFNLWVQQLARDSKWRVELDPKHVIDVLTAAEGS